jgi:hypothetical protein
MEFMIMSDLKTILKANKNNINSNKVKLLICKLILSREIEMILIIYNNLQFRKYNIFIF